MKVLLICTFFAAFAGLSVCDNNEALISILKLCNEEHKISDAESKVLDHLFHYKAEILSNPNPSENVKCHLNCVMEKRGYIKGGVLDADAMAAGVKGFADLKDREPAIVKAIGECKNEKGINDCDTAFKLATCLTQHAH